MTGSYGVEDRFARITITFSVLLLLLGGIFGLAQVINRAPYFELPSFLEVSPKTYYTFLTGHGVFLAVAIPIFWITGFTAYLAPRVLGKNLRGGLLRLSLLMMFAGAIMAAAAILSGRSAVLYTFYAPLKAHPLFYLGAALLVLGSWVFAAAFFLQYLEWRRENRGRGTPIAVYGLLTTFIVWIEATVPLVIDVLKNLLPMSLFGAKVDALEARTWFWFFGHPLVYFWLLPIVTLWYYMIPKMLGVRIFSEKMARVAFIMFIIASTPVGLHHQLVDPGVSAVYKYLQVLLTLVVASPSLLTAFNILATMEMGGKARGGGALSWILKQPWGNPVYAGLAVTFIVFGIGGLTGIINAGYQLNLLVHNTTWIVGHFHMTVATIVAVGYIAATYSLLAELFGKGVKWPRLALAQPYLWLVGILIFSFSYYIAGMEGAPRRMLNIEGAGGPPIPSEWIYTLQLGAVGGIVMSASGALAVLVFFYSLLRGGIAVARIAPNPHPEEGDPYHPLLENWRLWIAVAIVLILVAYIPTFYELYSRGLAPVSPVGV
ncbi:MAG: cbb3-type cytochrome c oxidase subunit I [Desulfurococcales archaeon]|nr:cbb3-type cytochrome c oxidase subunit I [Desulfurococcales archaeon]